MFSLTLANISGSPWQSSTFYEHHKFPVTSARIRGYADLWRFRNPVIPVGNDMVLKRRSLLAGRYAGFSVFSDILQHCMTKPISVFLGRTIAILQISYKVPWTEFILPGVSSTISNDKIQFQYTCMYTAPKS